MNKPNERHELFCREYVRRPVGSAAAIAAGYEESNAAAQACRLLARVDIQGRIAALREEVAVRQVADTNAVLARLQSIYELALEQNQLNTALRAVAMQLKLAEAFPAWRKAAQSAQPARAAATPDFDAVLDALEASLPPAGAAKPAPPAPDPQALPEPAIGGSEKPTDANRCQSSGMFSAGPGRAAAASAPAGAAAKKPIKAHKRQSFDIFSGTLEQMPFMPDTLTARVALPGG